MRLEVRHLELLLAVEECSSISGAARALGVDQSQVTRQLRRVEERLGSPVFTRTPRGVTPTASGLRVLALARRALDVMHDIATVQDENRSADQPMLRVLYYGLPAITILDDLARKHPDLQIHFSATTPEDAYDQLRAGAADTFLGVWLPHVEWPSPGPLAAVEILADPTYVYMAVDHPAAAKRDLRLSDLTAEQWITGIDPDSWRMVSEECRLVGGFEPLLSHRVSDETAVSTLLSRGLGVALGSSVAARRAGVVGRPYHGSSPARWMQVYVPARVDRDVAATIAELFRTRYAEWSEAIRGSGRAAHSSRTGDPSGSSPGGEAHR
ncbi:MAG TPA: LysR family transcriptional regulator [Pseudonocardia sp.]|nr:LysR family transcriptional regulator [Pseudonocardia sp.]